ncbi:MAG: hypothetical protein MHM6MM_002111 [Cercozoa sp. M6MM]
MNAETPLIRDKGEFSAVDITEIDAWIDEQRAQRRAFINKILCACMLIIAGLLVAVGLTQEPLIAIGIWPVLAFLLTAVYTDSFGPTVKFNQGATGRIFGPAFVPPGWTQMWDPMNCCVVWREDATGNFQYFPPPVMRGQEHVESKAKVTVAGNGTLESTDDLVVNNRDELWNFVRMYSSPPRLSVRVHGTHTEKRHSGKKNETRTVTDFLYEIDANDAISTLDVDLSEAGEVVEEFAGCNARLKEFNLKKVFEWNMPFLVEAIRSRCRELGYLHKVSVTLVSASDTIRVYRDTRRARLFGNFWFRFLLLALLPPLMCLVWTCWRCGVKRFQGEARFQQLTSAEQWFQTHFHEIRTQSETSVHVERS